MNLPPQDSSQFYNYQNSMNRPPTANRQPHENGSNGGSGSPSAGMFGRQTFSRGPQPPPPPPPPPSLPAGPSQGSPNIYATMDERSTAYDQFAPPPTNHYASYNHMAWNYNAGNSMNGAATTGFGDGSRARGGNRRMPLPAYWTAPDQPSASIAPQNGLHANSYSQPQSQQQQQQQQSSNGFGSALYPPQHSTDSLGIPQNGYLGSDLRHASHSHHGEDLIPTAIVIKNIPFNVRKEALEIMMDEMSLPKPYAFNYHFDKQVFRGLAFANFQSADDTRMVINHLNGYEVHGRKLRVEYKKMLPEQERDRIEREKRQKRGQLQEQHQSVPLQHQTSMQSLTNGHEAAQARQSPIPDLDFNNTQVLEFYTKLAVFKSSNQEIIVFPGDTTPEQRRIIHSLAHNMGLEHSSHGAGDQRQVRVYKNTAASANSVAQPGAEYRQPVHIDTYDNNRILNRAATIDFGESRLAAGNGYATIGRQNPTLELPEGGFLTSSAREMRGVKSHADLRSNLRFDTRTLTPSPSPLQSAYGQGQGHSNQGALYEGGNGIYGVADAFNSTSNLTTPSTPGGPLANMAFGASETSLTSGISALGLGNGGLETSRPQREGPGAIGSQRPSMSQLRNPRASDREQSGFNPRPQANGHTQRGSGSSNLASQDSYSELLTGSQSDKRTGGSGSGSGGASGSASGSGAAGASYNH